jgi:hypothetical protein
MDYMQNKRLEILFEKYLNNQLNSAELDEFFSLLNSENYQDSFNEYLLKQFSIQDEADIQIPDNISDKILRNISEKESFATKSINNSYKIKRLPAYFLAAASVLLVVCFSYLLFPIQKTVSFTSIIPNENIIYKKNNSNKPFEIHLADGSLVILKPNASIYYSNRFNDNKREIFLEGDAYFNVFKDKQRPFLVYSGLVITKVLGTSFTIKNSTSGNTEVEVRSGKVQVFENKELTGKDRSEMPPVLLLPNQKVVYKTELKNFETKLVDSPILVKEIDNYISESKEHIQFVFNRDNLKTIIEEFKRNYGVEIIVENEDLNNCVFTGDVTEQDLYTKLKIICLTINANYEINGTKILITGSGCKNK